MKFKILIPIFAILLIPFLANQAFAVIGTPFLTPTSQTFNPDITITFHSSDGINQIQYTTDGSDPTLGGTLANDGDTLLISTTTTVNFAETDDGGTTFGGVFSETYTLDTAMPVITLIGDASVTLRFGATYVDAGATALDAEDGDLTSSIITVNPVNTLIAGTYFVTYDVSDSAGNTATQVVRTVIVNQKANHACRGDCTFPTMSLFSVDDKSVKPLGYYTPFPLVTANTGENKTFTMTGCDAFGISHVALALGLTQDQYFSEAKAILIGTIAFNGETSFNEIDPTNSIDLLSYGITTLDKCTSATFKIKFREPLAEGKIGVDVWDTNHNSLQAYFNHGIQIIGDSMNPAPWKFVAPTAHNLGINIDNENPQVMVRNYDGFVDIKTGQANAALELAKSLYGSNLYGSFEYDVKSGMYPYHDRMAGKLHQLMLKEEMKATTYVQSHSKR